MGISWARLFFIEGEEMNISVYCGSSFGNKEIYKEAAEELALWMAKKRYTLVYGGAQNGLMGVVASTVLENDGKVIGILPNVPLIQERKQQGLTEYIETETMAQRKSLMIEKSDAFIALPGGIGTLDELSEVMTLSMLKEISGPIIIYNVGGYYNPLKLCLENMYENEFASRDYFEKVLISDDLDEIEYFIEKNR